MTKSTDKWMDVFTNLGSQNLFPLIVRLESTNIHNLIYRGDAGLRFWSLVNLNVLNRYRRVPKVSEKGGTLKRPRVAFLWKKWSLKPFFFWYAIIGRFHVCKKFIHEYLSAMEGFSEMRQRKKPKNAKKYQKNAKKLWKMNCFPFLRRFNRSLWWSVHEEKYHTWVWLCLKGSSSFS